MNKKILAITPFVVTLIYLLLGFIVGGSAWAYGVLLFLLIPIMPYVLRIKKISTISVSLAVTIIYLIMCLTAQLVFNTSIWHPGWLIFFLVPIIEILKAPSKEASAQKNKDEDKDDEDDDDVYEAK